MELKLTAAPDAICVAHDLYAALVLPAPSPPLSRRLRPGGEPGGLLRFSSLSLLSSSAKIGTLTLSNILPSVSMMTLTSFIASAALRRSKIVLMPRLCSLCMPATVTRVGSAQRNMRPRRTERGRSCGLWAWEGEMGNPPMSRKLEMPSTSMKGGLGRECL